MPESEFAFEDRILQPGDLWKWSIDDSVRSCRCQVSSHFSIRKEIPADDDIGYYVAYDDRICRCNST
jgi:hypothetical protein